MRDFEKLDTEQRPRRAHDGAATSILPETVFALVTTLAGFVIVVGLACSSASPAAETWTASYVDPPDRVWAAINQTLETLGYEIEQANRHESIIVAISAVDETAPAVTLRIAQVAHTEVIRVHVSPAGGGTDTDRFDVAASEFLTALDATMEGGARATESNEP